LKRRIAVFFGNDGGLPLRICKTGLFEKKPGNVDGRVKSQNWDGFGKSSQARRANPEE